MIDNLQEILSQIDDVPKDIDHSELEKWLKSQDSKIGKMQQSISKTSDRYGELKEKRELVEQALKLLRRETGEQKNQGGLVPRGTDEQAAQVENPFAAYEKRHDEIPEIWNGYDLEAKKRLYREVSIGAENGDGDFIYILGWFCAKEGKRNKAARLWKMAAEKGNPWAIYRRAWGFHYGMKEYGYPEDLQKAFEEYGRFLAIKIPLNLTKNFDRRGLIGYYETGLELDRAAGKQTHLGTTEEIEEKLKPLWEQPTGRKETADEGRILMGDILSDRGKIAEAVGYYIDVGWDACVGRILECYEKMTDIQMKQNLENRIIHARETGSKKVRDDIYCWYGKRYEEGVEVKRDRAKAFMFYWEAEKTGSHQGSRKRIAMLTEAKENMDLLAEDFLESIGDAGYWDAYKYLGDHYACMVGLSNYEKAQEYYLKGQNGKMKEECKKQCERMSRLIEQAIVYNSAVKLLNTDRYEYAFQELLKLAQKDYPEACMKVAEISENKTDYLSLKLKNNLLSNRAICSYYKQAALAGMPGAIRKMIEMYRDGILGMIPDAQQRKRWEEKLENVK